MTKKSVPPDQDKRGRGRPPLGNAVMVPLRLPAEMVAAIDEAAGPGRRAAFVRAAIERELARRRKSI